MAESDIDRERAVAAYFKWNADGLVQSLSVLGTACVLLLFAAMDRLIDTGIGYHGRATHLWLLACAAALAAPIGFRQRHVMLILRQIALITAALAASVPLGLWRVMPAAAGAKPHLPASTVVLSTCALIPALAVFVYCRSERWQAFLQYCRTRSVWNRPRPPSAGTA